MSHLRAPLLACSGLLTLLLCAPGTAAHAESLTEAVVTALNQHPSVGAAKANFNAYQEEESEKRSGYFPKVSVTAQSGRMYADNSTSRGLSVTRGAGYSWIHEGTVTMSQMLFDGFETSRRVAAADARVESADFDIASVREDLALKTALAYLDVLRTRDAAEAIRAHHAKIADYRVRIGKMVAEGAADKSMDSQARDIQIQLESTLADMEAQQRAAIAQYMEMTGHAPTDPMTEPAFSADLLPEAAADAVKYAYDHSPSLQSRILTGDSLAADAKAEQSQLYPDLNGELSYLKTDKDDLIGGEAVDARAVLKMSWNFSTGGAELARMRKAKYRAIESKSQAEEIRRQIEREINVAYSDMEKARDQFDLQSEREKVSAELFTNYESQFEGARINLLQLLQSDNGHFTAQLAMLNARYRLMAARFSALSSMGRLQEALNIAPVAAARDDG
jgi:adhesin transport system outer membrane protein